MKGFNSWQIIYLMKTIAKITYISQIIEQINVVTESCGQVLLYGENIDKGSMIAGLARGLKVNPAGKILNVGNCELAHCGLGMGIMLDGGNAVLFMKQLDFLLLGVDHLVNTYNFIRAYRSSTRLGSFTIFPIVCDQGYQGPQSSLNSAGDLASLADIDVYCLNAKEDAAYVIGDAFVKPGLRIICTSQRMFGESPLEIPMVTRSPDNAIYKYMAGSSITIMCYNFSLRKGLEIADQLRLSGISADLFHINFVPRMKLEILVESCARTGKLVILDDSKSAAKFGDMLISELYRRGVRTSIRFLTRRGCPSGEHGVSSDQFQIDHEAVVAFAQAG